jgi:hypothetical protein
LVSFLGQVYYNQQAFLHRKSADVLSGSAQKLQCGIGDLIRRDARHAAMIDRAFPQ